MGKNGKKVKSDRINAVRKQYDAFLEEDRKRKDRNEYILERLDRMRSCTAVVPVRRTPTTNAFDNLGTLAYDKTNTYTGRILSYEKPRYNSDQFHNASRLKTLDEEALIKELSKKYILIPKHQHAMDFEYKYPTKSSVEDVNDWRSKYSILEELKKGEKEEGNEFIPTKDTLSNRTHFEGDDNKERNLNDRVDKPELVIKANNNLQKFPNSYEPSLHTGSDDGTQNMQIEKEPFNTTDLIKNVPVADKSFENNASELTSSIECFNQSTDDLTEKEKLQTKYELECKPELEENCLEETHNKQYPSAETGWQEEVELLPKSGQNAREEINVLPIQSDMNPNNDKIDVHVEDYNPSIEENQKSEVNLEMKSTEPEMFNPSNTHQRQINEHDIQAMTKEEVIDETTVLNNPEMQPEITENTSPQVEVQQEQYQEPQTNSQQEYEDIVDETQIQDFENEQNNMFYSEQTGDYTYEDQAGTTDNTTVEYANNEAYEQNENYAYYEESPNNQVYPNDYQETPQSQDYSNEVNEHEESTEQYDPNYQNQYENYGQEDPQPETVQEYIEGEGYETQQNFDQAIYDESNYNVVEEVQQHLDDEEGYTKPLEAVEGSLPDNVVKEEVPEDPNIEQEVKVTS